MNIPETMLVTIDRIGGLGDGVGRLPAPFDGPPVVVPYTLTGDQVRVRVMQKNNKRIQAELLEVVVPSPQRAEPMCEYFTQCGGCQLLHMKADAYTAFKTQQLQTLLQRVGAVEVKVEPLQSFGTSHRRRLELSVAWRGDALNLGFYQPQSHDLVPVQHCNVAVPVLSELLVPLRDWLSTQPFARMGSRVQLTECQNGVDVQITLSGSVQGFQTDASSIERNLYPVVRIVLITSPESTPAVHQVLYQRQLPTIMVADCAIPLPVGGFVQASEAAQHAMVALVKDAIPRDAAIVDLYSGMGTFTLPLLARGQRVAAYEGAATSIHALRDAGAEYLAADRLKAVTRDLYRMPLTVKELNRYDAAIINPPRNGAEPQYRALAQSSISRVVIISCGLQSLERDIKHLLAAKFSVVRAIPVDQFFGTPHLETVLLLTR